MVFAIGESETRKARGQSPTETLRRAMRDFGEVLAPHDAEEPILAPVARAALFEWMTEMRLADEMRDVGLKPRSTALLVGPPGCGKTTYAHHLAARLGVPMLLVGAENITRSYHGESEQRMARLFDKLAECEIPCVLLLDEIEAIAADRRRNTGGGGADNARTATLTVLLRYIEAFTGVLVAATNMPDILDPAIWRRFGLQVTIDLPGEDERFAIMRRYLKPFDLPDEAIDLLCSLTDGASPALLRGLMEGIKRALVLGPKIGRPPDDPVLTITRIVAAVKPPPGIDAPPLWASVEDRRQLKTMAWPPTRPAAPPPAKAVLSGEAA